MDSQDEFLLQPSDVRFGRSGDGQIIMRRSGAFIVVGTLMAASPITDPRHMVSVRNEHGEEVGILSDVDALDEISRQIVVEELERTYFMPRITDVYDIHDDLGVVSWEVATDKGDRSFHVRNIRQNVRKMGRRRLVIRDVDGNRYEIRDWARLPAPAEKLLEPYL